MERNEAYRKAEQKIEKAQGSGAKELDLSGMKFTELPESLGQLTQLQSLDLSSNQLTALPEWLGQLTQLQSLNLSGNQLTALPEWLGQLTQLQSLNLSGNQRTALPEWLGQLTQLQSLHLSRNRLTALPEWLGELTQLQSLNLSSNQLTTLPEWLGELTQLQSLNLSSNQLTALPEWLGELTQLQSLNLSRNRLTALPESLGQLMQLRSLNFSGNQLTALPEWLGQLTQLETLDLSNNQLKALPGSLGQLTQLQLLDLSDNQLTALPESLGQLAQLQKLRVFSNQLTTLPESFSGLVSLTTLVLGDTGGGGNPLRELPGWLGRLKQIKGIYASRCELKSLPDWVGECDLEILYFNKNDLTDLPVSLGRLQHVKHFMLNGNPLNPELATAYGKGFDVVKQYLREMAKGGKSRYEAKLLILGDGNEGKTCVSRALRGLPFEVQQTTRGVDVVQWKFPHPDDEPNREKEITLNIWDFEGQEISHQTHQFFLTSQSLYLLVFKCRDQFLMDRAEYWLDTIRARAPQAKVVIVISQCEERSPHLPLDKIQAQYGDMLAKEWLFAVGCENGKNIEKLRAFLRRSAADLEFMGAPWPQSYEKAEADIKAKAETDQSHITRVSLNGLLRTAGVSDDNFDGAAGSMARIGAITQFPDCPDLRDFVVLKPQWLTKAISKVMEDGQLSEDKGEIELKRMAGIWSNTDYRGMFATFHDCMKEFELCYDLEDARDTCLVPLRFGYVAPTIPWTDAPGLKERRMEYKLNLRPPMGIMSRFIVKTHHMIGQTKGHPKGIYWHNGVFLRSNSPYPSEALVEFVPEERTFKVEVRAAFPQNLCEQIHAYLQAVFSFFTGLSAERSYGCIKVDSPMEVETRCSGSHTEKRIYAELSQQRTLRCEFEEHDVEPQRLVGGFSSFNEFVMGKLTAQLRRELDKPPEWAAPFLRGMGALLDWVQTNGGKLDQLLLRQAALSAEFKQEAESKLRKYLEYISQMLDDRDHTAAPGLISITTKDRSRWNPTGYFNRTYILTPFCECEGNIHACEDGRVEFTKPKEWWQATAPWIARATKVLAAGLQLGFAGMPLVLGSDAAKLIEHEVKFMGELTKHVQLEAPKESEDSGAEQVISGDVGKDLRGNDREAAVTRAALARFLEETAPDNYRAKRWGSLSRVRMSDNSYRWLCDSCLKDSR